jgi:hypothetical protein
MAKFLIKTFKYFCFSTKDGALVSLILKCGVDIEKTGWIKFDEEWKNLKPIEFAMIRQSRSSEEQFWKIIVKSLTDLYLQQEEEKMDQKSISGA